MSREQLILSLLLLEFLVFLLSGVSFSGLHGNSFFSINADPAYWLIFLLRLPQIILSNLWLGVALDLMVLILLLKLISNPHQNKVGIFLFFLLLCFYVTVTGYLTHRNYQSGIFLTVFPFMFSGRGRNFAFDAARYFLLFFYFSSALLKLSSGSLNDLMHFGRYLSGQFTPYIVEGNTGLRTSLNIFLVNQPFISYSLYLCSFLIELITVAGFFTRKFDKWLGILLLLFHLFNWVIMDIGAIGHLAFVSLLFLKRNSESMKGK